MADEQTNPEPQKGSGIEKIDKKLVQENPNLFQGIPKERRLQIIRTLLIQKSHIGPLPDVETLDGYARLIPDGAERIMQMAERQQAHRISLEDKVVSGQITQSNIGQWLAFFIGLAALGGAVYCIAIGAEIGGSVLGVGGITGLVTAFIQGRKSQEKELKEKA